MAAAAGVGSSARGWGGVFAAASPVSSPDLSRLEPLAERGDVGVVGPGDELDDVGRGRRRLVALFFPAVEAAAEEKTAAAADAADTAAAARRRSRGKRSRCLCLCRRARDPVGTARRRRSQGRGEKRHGKGRRETGPPPGARH